MLNFTADPRDGYKYSAGCNTCCCTEIRMKPGETDLLRIHYAGWVIPLMGRGLTINTWFDVTKISPEIAAGGNVAPNVALRAAYTTAMSTVLNADLNSYVVNPDGGPLKFKLLRIYGPNNGSMTVQENGMFTYTPANGYNGADVFYYEVTDGFHPRVGFGVIAVGTASVNDVAIPDKVYVTPRRKQIDIDYHFMSVPLTVDPTAIPGDIYRLNVRQEAVDCDGNPFYHVSCYDIIVGKC